MRHVIVLMALATVAACARPIPDSGAGVGFDDYATYELDRARREAALTGTAPSLTAPPAVTSGVIPSTDLAAAGIGVSPGAVGLGGVTAGALAPGSVAPIAGAPLNVTALGAVSNPLDPNRTAGVQASPSNAAPVLVGVPENAAISDEQDFDAVASRETIESDAARRAQQAAQYQVIQPTALPTPQDAGPNIVEYALNAPNRKGQEWYSRMIWASERRAARNCAAYRSADEAQRDFLARGGPERDSRGLDPDGDGFACGWDPAPFLAAVGRS